MKKNYEPSPFALSADAFAKALPVKVEIRDEDAAPIILPKWRYDEIACAVLEMYEKTNACVMPLPVFDIANSLGCSLVPYRAYQQRFIDILLAASQDAFTMQFSGSSTPVILYNDRRIPTRINYSIMHELGHISLGHKEPSLLAEKEANYFAGVALCPVALLIHYNLTDARKVSELFNVSDEFARNRLRAAKNRLESGHMNLKKGYDRAFIERFQFNRTFQLELFKDFESEEKAQ